MRRFLALLVLLLATAAAPAGAAPVARVAEVHDCHHKADFNILISSARNMRCRTAARDMKRYRASIKRTFTTPGGFHCRRVHGGRLGGQWRCVRRHKAYRFEFGD